MNSITRFTARASLVSLALIGASAFAQDTSATGPTRAEVVAATLAARANGTMTPAGQAATPRTDAWTATSQLSRASVAADTRAARAAGELQPAGEAAEFVAVAPTNSSVYSRAEVKASVIAARRAGELVPAGEGSDDSGVAQNKQAAAYRTAQDATRAERVAGR